MDVYLSPYAEVCKAYPGAYIASWTAAEHWNIIDELARDIFVFSKDKEETKKVDGFTVHVKKVPENLFFDLQEIETLDDELFCISSPTKTMIDCFMYPDLAGGSRQVDYIFSLYRESPYFDQRKLLSYAKKTLPAQKITHILKLLQEDLS